MNPSHNVDLNKERLRDRCHHGSCSKFAWSAVVAGALVGTGICFLFNLFGIASGIAAFATTTTSDVPTLVIGGLIAVLIGTIISTGAMGWVAGYLAGLKSLCCRTDATGCNYGCLYGFIAWCLSLLIMVVLSTQVVKFISYSTVALTNPAVAVQNYAAPEPQVTTERRTAAVQPTVTPQTQDEMTPSEREAAKSIATTSFVVFLLFFVGAVSASLFGHIAFDRCMRKHLNRP